MMKKYVFAIILITLLFAPLSRLQAQNNITDTQDLSFDRSTVPQWAKDLRRFDIIAFGTFPFSMFFATFFYDLVRWNEANGMDFSNEGRRYAPWPLRSAGGYEMTGQDYQKVLLIAAGISLTFALTDLIITKIKRNRERGRIESQPSDSYEIERLPYGEPDESPPN